VQGISRRRRADCAHTCEQSGLAELFCPCLTDLTGPFYTVVLELTVPSLSAFETEAPHFMADKDFQANCQKLVRLVESGKREIFTILE
jgi:hypothetical protein